MFILLFLTKLLARFTNTDSRSRIMPPIRRGRRSSVHNADAAILNDSSVQQLRNLCRQRNIASWGNRTTLLSWLSGYAPQVASLNERVRANNLPVRENTRAGPQDNVVNASANDSSFTEGQLNVIRRLVQEAVSAASREIANEAALAAVQVLQPNSSPSAPTSSHTAPSVDLVTPQLTSSLSDVQHAAPLQDIPAQHVKDIQSGEFFELSKLLPRNLSALNEEDNLVLSLDNSVVRVSKKAKMSTSITDIEQWTTAFTTYMSVFTQKFPQRSQELLQYLSLIRYGARVHKRLGWAIYDYKFRQKAAQNKTRVWSEIDQQLWLMIFTVAPSLLKEEFPLFSKGPQINSVSSGAQRRGTCHTFNRTG